ncbi:MAG: SufB/SufD family protein [Eubacteriaceae bacterium]|jgi:Fe-S cluster assembly scaffold protein SufB
MKLTTEELLKIVSDWKGSYEGSAFNIREDGACAGRQSSKNIQIDSKEDAPGLVIHVKPYTKDETVYIPACVTHSDVDDLVYNDFYIGKGADVTIVAGCGVHTTDGHDARHNGIHRFFLEEDSRVLYEEKHVGTGNAKGLKIINPVTDADLKKNAVLTMDTSQLGGVDTTDRKTRAKLADGAKLYIKEHILTEGIQTASTDFEVEMNGYESGVDLISRSVAKGNSVQHYHSVIRGKNKCSGHSECDAILVDDGKVGAQPELIAESPDAALIHEAAIGKIAGEQILKLETLGLTEKEAEETIISGFLK